MQDPSEPDRHEILSGPGDVRLAQRSDGRGAEPPKNKKKTIAIAASALVAVLAAGGVGYMLAANPTTPATQQGNGGPATSQSADPNVQGDDATVGDVATDAPNNDLPDDGSMGDADTDTGTGGDPVADTGSDTGSDSSTGSRGTQTGTGGQRPSTSSPTKAPQEPAADNPADGPAGELSGQCATSGC
ncbi:hypothetical protein EDD27_0443 [Nonomuraea polychroma]|uniref:Uncharacterized protein n=1 Tax=Nonomuraea polychroma TaxID=46176 RepID=A0A438LXC3_9ACTN|nr:hypothetical protein [Nonomuraea polychroma]RVX38150.1 hypothetical protein EDD27_0443 [Nonomuraea polychroma]